MPLGKIVNTANNTATVELFEKLGGQSILYDVLIQLPFPECDTLPKNGTRCRVAKEGSEWIITGYLKQTDPQTQAKRDEENLMGGDVLFGSASGPCFGFYNGGFVVLKGNPITGFTASEEGDATIMGDMVSILNAVYQLVIKSEDGGAVVTENILRALDGASVIKKRVDANAGIYELEIDHLKNISIKVNLNNLLLPLEGGTDIKFELKSQTGKTFELSVDPVTAKVVCETEGILKFDGKKIILGNLTDFPGFQDGILTGRTRCYKTLLPHAEPSKKVFAESGEVI
jgi:hypothetical protein